MRITTILLVSMVCFSANAQGSLSPENVSGFCIAAPKPDRLEQFVRFMQEDLGPAGINTLILRIDYNYAYTSYPNLSEENPLSKADVRLLVNTAKEQNMVIIPQINLLGHQSWHSKTSKLLEEYPEFDETPHVRMPEVYEWPNEDSLYCKSYCPLHPEVHDVVFALVDEMMLEFEASTFHAGMDEVFYIGDDHCPRCADKDKAELFAREVKTIRDHLAASGRELWIWGDRLIDGEATGLGMWEASENDTYAAIDLIPKDVVICDWHYENAAPTPAYFATKGFRVVSCFWNRPEVATAHIEMIEFFQNNGPEVMKRRFTGTMQTVWSPAGAFLDAYYGERSEEGLSPEVASFKAMIGCQNP